MNTNEGVFLAYLAMEETVWDYEEWIQRFDPFSTSSSHKPWDSYSNDPLAWTSQLTDDQLTLFLPEGTSTSHRQFFISLILFLTDGEKEDVVHARQTLLHKDPVVSSHATHYRTHYLTWIKDMVKDERKGRNVFYSEFLGVLKPYHAQRLQHRPKVKTSTLPVSSRRPARYMQETREDSLRLMKSPMVPGMIRTYLESVSYETFHHDLFYDRSWGKAYIETILGFLHSELPTLRYSLYLDPLRISRLFHAARRHSSYSFPSHTPPLPVPMSMHTPTPPANPYIR